jgi:hypothetical protein
MSATESWAALRPRPGPLPQGRNLNSALARLLTWRLRLTVTSGVSGPAPLSRPGRRAAGPAGSREKWDWEGWGEARGEIGLMMRRHCLHRILCSLSQGALQLDSRDVRSCLCCAIRDIAFTLSSIFACACSLHMSESAFQEDWSCCPESDS